MKNRSAPTIVPRPLPGLASYHVVSAEEPGAELEVAIAALRLGRALGERHFGDPGSFAVLMSGARGRRRGWPHAHVVAVRDVAHKRRTLLLLLLKGWLARYAAWRSEGDR